MTVLCMYNEFVFVEKMQCGYKELLLLRTFSCRYLGLLYPESTVHESMTVVHCSVIVFHLYYQELLIAKYCICIWIQIWVTWNG